MHVWFLPKRFSLSTAQVQQVSIVSVFRILDILRGEVFKHWENSLEGPGTNHASFYGPGKLKRPFVAFFLFSFSSMALPLDPLGQSVRV
jgi:hypothetical protein